MSCSYGIWLYWNVPLFTKTDKIQYPKRCNDVTTWKNLLQFLDRHDITCASSLRQLNNYARTHTLTRMHTHTHTTWGSVLSPKLHSQWAVSWYHKGLVSDYCSKLVGFPKNPRACLQVRSPWTLWRSSQRMSESISITLPWSVWIIGLFVLSTLNWPIVHISFHGIDT